MKSVIAFRDGRRVNLAGGVDPETYAELEATQGRGTRNDPLLSCGGCGGGVYVRHGAARRDELFGAHFEGNCPETLAIRKSTMSDEHKRIQEYTVRSAGEGGFPADTEVRTSGRTVVDVVIDGRIGVEVQLSKLTAGAAVRRTGRSMAAGLETVAWCDEKTGAAWTGKVPGYQWLDNGQLLQGMPRPRSVRSRGLYTFRAERFGATWMPVLEPQTALVDDAVVEMAAGTVRPVMYGAYVQLVKADGIALFEEMTGRRLPPFAGIAPTRTLPRAAEAMCGRPRIQVAAKMPTCYEPDCDESPRAFLDGQRWCVGHARRRALAARPP